MTAADTIARRAELACRLAALRDAADVARWEDDGGSPAPAPAKSSANELRRLADRANPERR